jgi:hypothetical protein
LSKYYSTRQLCCSSFYGELTKHGFKKASITFVHPPLPFVWSISSPSMQNLTSFPSSSCLIKNTTGEEAPGCTHNSITFFIYEYEVHLLEVRRHAFNAEEVKTASKATSDSKFTMLVKLALSVAGFARPLWQVSLLTPARCALSARCER